MSGLLLAAGAMVGYGLGDFLGGLFARRVGVLPVLVVGQPVGLAVLLAGSLLVGPAAASGSDLAWGALAGASMTVGGWLLLRGFRVGRLSVVSPVSSLGAAGIPLAFDMLADEQLSTTALSGMAAGLAAISLVGTATPEGDDRPGNLAGGLWYGIGAGVGFATAYLSLDQSDPASGPWPVVAAQAMTVLLVSAAAALARQRPDIPAVALPGVAGVGIATALATLCFLLAARAGLVSIAALIASLSPAVTVILARTVLRELLPPRQLLGLVAAATALVLIGLG